MDEEVEDLVGDVKYTNSSKSITTSILCSYDLSDSSPERNHSSDRNTYILGYDDTDSESTERTFELQHNLGFTNMLLPNGMTGNLNLKAEKLYLINKHIHQPSAAAQEICTQTSKTIMQLAESERVLNKKDTEHLQTQTSCISLCADNFLKYNINENGQKINNNIMKINEFQNIKQNDDANSESLVTNNLDQSSTDEGTSPLNSDRTSNDDGIQSKHEISLENNLSNEQEQNEIEHLYKKVLENIQIQTDFVEHSNNIQRTALSPVTEESTNKSIIDITPNEVLVGYEFMNDTELSKTKYAWPEEINNVNLSNNIEQLPLIKNYLSCPNTPNSNLMFTYNSKSGNLFTTGDTEKVVQFESNTLASGENHVPDSKRQSIDIYLPPIHNNGNFKKPAPNSQIDKMFRDSQNSGAWHIEPICINEKIQELKLTPKESPRTPALSSAKSYSPEHEIGERSCEALCIEILRRLRSSSWTEVVEALEWIPKCLENFWDIISETRIADLIRQITTSIESPRTQVSKAACMALTIILQKTKYVKKPEFYEAMSSLLNKTGSYSRPLRRVANLSLDRIVCEVDTTHAVTALCMYGTSHKSGLVRSAAARLLVVSAALAAGGRHLLRSRPSTVATARQHLLRSLSTLLEDKNGETRKFSERLYSIIRPLKNFEAYFLNDVNVDLASRLMKKYDQTICTIGNETILR